MPFKVRFRLIAFMGDEEKYPCCFGYKIGDEIIYDGEEFTGRICLSLLPNMALRLKSFTISVVEVPCGPSSDIQAKANVIWV